MFSNLFNKIKSIFSKKQEDPEELFDRYDVYLPRERLIYSFFDGQQMRHVDPLVLYRKLGLKEAEIIADIKSSSVTQSKFAAKAHETLINNIREVFDVKPISEGGLGELECLNLLDHFWDYVNLIKKNSPQSQTDVEATSLSTASPTEKASDLPTTKNLDSGSTEKEPSIKQPQQSASEPCTPPVPSDLGQSSTAS